MNRLHSLKGGKRDKFRASLSEKEERYEPALSQYHDFKLLPVGSMVYDALSILVIVFDNASNVPTLKSHIFSINTRLRSLETLKCSGLDNPKIASLLGCPLIDCLR